MMNYDFFGQEWSFLCKSCDTMLYAPTKKEMWYSHWVHTHKECLGGW
jgi:hypothetical protein